MTKAYKKPFKTIPNRFYVYVLRDPRNGQVFYVGCTKDPNHRGAYPKQDYNNRVLGRIGEISASGATCERVILCVLGTAEHAAYQEEHAIRTLRSRGSDLFNAKYSTKYPTQKIPWDVPACT